MDELELSEIFGESVSDTLYEFDLPSPGEIITYKKTLWEVVEYVFTKEERVGCWIKSLDKQVDKEQVLIYNLDTMVRGEDAE